MLTKNIIGIENCQKIEIFNDSIFIVKKLHMASQNFPLTPTLSTPPKLLASQRFTWLHKISHGFTNNCKYFLYYFYLNLLFSFIHIQVIHIQIRALKFSTYFLFKIELKL
ncbi:hypothetical protein ACKWTF_002603 [Chironomus riparius]